MIDRSLNQICFNKCFVEKQRSRGLTLPTDMEPELNYGAVPEPLPYEEADSSDSGQKIKDALDSNEPSDVEVHNESPGMEYLDEFNPFGAN